MTMTARCARKAGFADSDERRRSAGVGQWEVAGRGVTVESSEGGNGGTRSFLAVSSRLARVAVL